MKTAFGEIPDRLARDMSMQERHDWLRARVSRRSVLRGAAVGGATLAASPLFWQQPSFAATGAAPGARHLQLGADPTTQMVVSWQNPAGAVPAPVVRVGLDTGYGRTLDAVTLDPGTAIGGGLQAKNSTGTLLHHALVSGLEPGTTYHYRVENGDGGVSPDATFTTAPEPGSLAPFTFTAYGDSDPSTPDTATIVGLIAARRPAFHLLAGDICYADNSGTGGEGDTYNAGAWDSYLTQIGPAAASTPWMVATGNHDMEPGYGGLGYDGVQQRFVPPTTSTPGSRGASYYAFRHANVGVLSLDANDVSLEIVDNLGYTGGAQTRWLDQQLATFRADPTIDFVVAYFHHCMYSTNLVHGSDGGPRAAWGPLFDRYTVDLVVNGHNHSYERSYPVRGGVTTGPVLGGPAAAGAPQTIHPETQGTTYITAGGGGRVAYPTFLAGSTVTTESGRQPEVAEWAGVENRYGFASFLAVDVVPAAAGQPTTMTVTAVRAADGGVQDRVVLSRTAGAVAPPPVVPEAPYAALLPVAALGVAGGAALLARARAAGEPGVLAADRASRG